MVIRVNVTLFGALKEVGNDSTFAMDLPPGSSVSDALKICGLPDRVDIWVLVDGQKVSRDFQLHEGAEIRFFQPVGGG